MTPGWRKSAAELLRQFDDSDQEAPVVSRLAQFEMKNGAPRGIMAYEDELPGEGGSSKIGPEAQDPAGSGKGLEVQGARGSSQGLEVQDAPGSTRGLEVQDAAGSMQGLEAQDAVMPEAEDEESRTLRQMYEIQQQELEAEVKAGSDRLIRHALMYTLCGVVFYVEFVNCWLLAHIVLT